MGTLREITLHTFIRGKFSQTKCSWRIKSLGSQGLIEHFFTYTVLLGYKRVFGLSRNYQAK